MKPALILIAIGILLTLGCSAKNNDAQYLPPSEEEASHDSIDNYPLATTEEDHIIGNFRLEMAQQELVRVMKGEKPKVSEDELCIIWTLTDGTIINFVKDPEELEVFSIEVSDPKYVTPRGLRVGDAASKLYKLYGRPCTQNPYDKYLVFPSKQGLELTVFNTLVEEGKVKKIRIGLSM